MTIARDSTHAAPATAPLEAMPCVSLSVARRERDMAFEQSAPACLTGRAQGARHE